MLSPVVGGRGRRDCGPSTPCICGLSTYTATSLRHIVIIRYLVQLCKIAVMAVLCSISSAVYASQNIHGISVSSHRRTLSDAWVTPPSDKVHDGEDI